MIITAFAGVSCRPDAPSASSLVESITVTESSITFTVVTFDRRMNSLIIADKPEGPESLWPTSKDAAEAHSGLAAINGGFFTKEDTPLGLVIADGKRSGFLNPSDDLGAAFYIDTPPSIISLKEYRALKTPQQNAIQAGPDLVWDGKQSPHLHQEKPRPRSFLLWDGGNRLALGHATASTLHELGAALQAQPIPDFKIHRALNLDGGRSSDLWISSKVKGGGITRRSWINKPVRNYLILKDLQ